MRCKGITYDTGFFPAGRSSRPDFEPEQVRRDMAVIAGELRCDAVRITGGDLDRLTVAARHAAAAGLEVWFSPLPCELDPEQTLRLLDAAAGRAQEVRDAAGAEVVLVLGGELSVFGSGFVPGADSDGRLASLLAPPPELLAGYEASVRRLNEVLAAAAAGARRRFGGPVTYAAALWEDIDWRPFDIVSADAYRDAANAAGYRDLIRGLGRPGKPVAVTEFGCCTYRGAAERGASGWTIVSGSGPERRIDGNYQRDEREQAEYLRELLDIYDDEGVDSAFWFSFANYDKPRRPDPREDLDLASFGLVAVLESARGPVDPGWEPKQAFTALARHPAGARFSAGSAPFQHAGAP